jgi:hypothetical protein
VASVVIQTQRESDFRGSQPSRLCEEEQPPKIVKKKLDLRGSMQTQREPDLRGSQWELRGRVSHSEGVPPQVQVGERHLPRLTGRCHGLRRPGRRLRSGRLLGVTCLPRRIHVFLQVLFS